MKLVGGEVAPRAGAWIETRGAPHIRGRPGRSRPARARGLKPNTARTKMATCSRSRPARARGLKPIIERMLRTLML